ncbi:fam-a protein [Plasmodium chabaudi chabaudi]|uniref:Fam-a protein n=1 Tax=Plasmodium chabaudi chabaudi TaxID=31271 RepID=A0A1C6WL55_PLACU|nr:fam-a protein [Plasmodium chabaudi chabaudi]
MNKGYIKIALALLSVAGYMQNVAFAIESAATTNSSNEENSVHLNLRYRQQESSDPQEARQAENVMVEALNLAKKHVEHTDDYKFYCEENGAILHFKPFRYTTIGKLEFTIPNANNYDDIVNMLWNSDTENNYTNLLYNGKIVRGYNKNLAIIQQYYQGPAGSSYYNAILNKVELSENETAIVIVSPDVKDNNPSGFVHYKNPIVTSANSFKPVINSERGVRMGMLHKTYINLMTLFIKKEEDDVKMTLIGSIEHAHVPDTSNPRKTLMDITALALLNITKLKNAVKRE